MGERRLSRVPIVNVSPAQQEKSGGDDNSQRPCGGWEIRFNIQITRRKRPRLDVPKAPPRHKGGQRENFKYL